MLSWDISGQLMSNHFQHETKSVANWKVSKGKVNCPFLDFRGAKFVELCMLQEPKTEWDTPRVSPYRLAAHLTSAFVIYSGLLWTSLNMLYPSSSAAQAPAVAAAGASALRKVAHPLAALIGITAVSGQSSAEMQVCRQALSDTLHSLSNCQGHRQSAIARHLSYACWMYNFCTVALQ